MLQNMIRDFVEHSGWVTLFAILLASKFLMKRVIVDMLIIGVKTVKHLYVTCALTMLLSTNGRTAVQILSLMVQYIHLVWNP